jgi:hypothetical protein
LGEESVLSPTWATCPNAWLIASQVICSFSTLTGKTLDESRKWDCFTGEESSAHSIIEFPAGF